MIVGWSWITFSGTACIGPEGPKGRARPKLDAPGSIAPCTCPMHIMMSSPQTIENVDVISHKDSTIIVANDNNFPYSMARTLGEVDDNEIIALHAPGFFNGGNC